MSEEKLPTAIELLQKVCDVMEDRELAEVYLREGEISLRVRRVGAAVPGYMAASPPAGQMGEASAPSASTLQTTGEIITSPMLGVFYRAPSPEEPPYVEVGSLVSEDDTLCMIEAMKIFNEVKADFPCEILEILVEDATAVEFNHPLFRVKRL